MAANLENTIQEKVKSLPPEKQRRVLSMVEEMLSEEDPTQHGMVKNDADIYDNLTPMEAEQIADMWIKKKEDCVGVRPLWEIAEEISSQVPLEEWEKLPVDGAEQHDHYLYGSPKRNND